MVNEHTSVKYPHITIKLTGTDGNAFVILGKVQQVMRRNKIPQSEID